MRTKIEITSSCKELEEEAAARYERENRESILSSVDIVNAFIAGAEWQKKQLEKPFEESKGMPRQKTAYINGLGVETR